MYEDTIKKKDFLKENDEIPFNMGISNKTTPKTIRDIENGKGLTKYETLDDFFEGSI